MKIRPEDLGCASSVKFVFAATGRAHTVLIASDGACFSAGLNSSGQVSGEEIPSHAGRTGHTDLLSHIVWSACLS
jgi:alpha-tubulin suppressor-like RCC1 family protein